MITLKEPALDLSETEKEVIVRLEVPGFHKENLDVKFENDLLTIAGHREYRNEVPTRKEAPQAIRAYVEKGGTERSASGYGAWRSLGSPPVSCFTTLFLRSTSAGQLIFGSPTSMPYSFARLICS